VLKNREPFGFAGLWEDVETTRREEAESDETRR